MKCAAFALSLLLFVPFCILAQQPDCRHRTIAASVVDEGNVPLAGLTPDNFRGEYRGEPVRVTSVKLDTSPRRIVILLDLSGSMYSENKSRVAEILVWHILRSSPTGTELALVTFSDQVKVQSGFLSNKADLANLAREVNFLDPKTFKGTTRLWDAIREVVKLFGPPRPGDVIYAVTDGGENSSRDRRWLAMQESLVSAGIRFFVAIVDANPGRRRMSPPADIPGLFDLSESTGGRLFDLRGLLGNRTAYDLSAKGQKEILEAASVIERQMVESYFLEIELAQEVDKPRSWKLKLVSENNQLKDFRLHFPRTLVPCSVVKGVSQSAPN